MKNLKLLLILTALLILNSACRQKINEIYLIPRGFTGNIVVVFEVKEGEKETIEDSSRVYRIPEDGILITQSGYNNTVHDEKYFFVDSSGERTPILGTFFADEEELRRQGLSDDDIFVRFNGAVGDSNPYSRHYVGSRKGMDASIKDFDLSEPMNLDTRVKSKLEKLRSGNVFE